MGCLGIGLAALLALAIPASIAPASLVGAYVVIVLLAAAAAGATAVRLRKRVSTQADKRARMSAVLVRLGVAVLLYGAVVTVVHALT